MLKKLTGVLLILFLVLSAGCGQTVPSEKETTPSEIEETDPEHFMEILDRDGKPVGQIDARASATAADAGIFYRIWDPGMDEKTATAEYRFFRLSDQKDVLLGTLEDQGYETFYTRTELNGIVYTLAVTGDPSDDENDTLWLLAFDGIQGTMEKYAVTDQGFPYSSLTVFDGKIFILNHETTEPKGSKVYRFDPSDKTVKEFLDLPEAVDGGTDSMRGICAAEDGIYLLRLRINAEGRRNLYLDRYDIGGKKISETSLNEMLIPAILNVHGIQNEGDAENEQPEGPVARTERRFAARRLLGGADPARSGRKLRVAAAFANGGGGAADAGGPGGAPKRAQRVRAAAPVPAQPDRGRNVSLPGPPVCLPPQRTGAGKSHPRRARRPALRPGGGGGERYPGLGPRPHRTRGAPLPPLPLRLSLCPLRRRSR